MDEQLNTDNDGIAGDAVGHLCGERLDGITSIGSNSGLWKDIVFVNYRTSAG
jgi:hypothetical protein